MFAAASAAAAAAAAAACEPLETPLKRRRRWGPPGGPSLHSKEGDE